MGEHGPAEGREAWLGRATAALARLRVTLGFVCGAVVFWLAEPSGATLVAGTLVAIPGEALRVWASGHLNKSRDVTTSGPYRWLAHPLYVGSTVIGAGLAIAANSLGVAALIAAYLLVALSAAISSEEAFLRRRFGDRYERYRRGDADGCREGARRGGDPASAPRRPDDRPPDRARLFSVARVVANREPRALVGLVLAVVLLALKATYHGAFGGAAAGR